MKGLFTALLTPFNENGKVLETALRQMVRYNIDVMQVDGLYIGGSTGEAFLMSASERMNVLEIVKDEAADRVHLIAQIGALDMDEAIQLGIKAKELGYNAISAITPFYYRFSFEEIYDYYKTLCEKISHPMIIYSNPSMSGSNFDLKKYELLLEIPNVIGVKYSDADVAKFERLRATFKDKLFYFGYDEISIVGFLLGCDGAIGSTYNVTGHLVKEMISKLNAGHVEEARELQNGITSVIERIVNNNLYPTLKSLLAERGILASHMKKPFFDLNAVQLQNIQDINHEIDSLTQKIKS